MLTVTPDPADPSSSLVRLKVVPGAKRSEVVGVLGDRLKVRVSAPPEDGRANKAVCELLAGALGVPPRSVEVVQGTTNPEKTVRISGATHDRVAAALGL